MVFLCTVFQGLKCRRENPYFRLWTCVFSVTQVAQGKESRRHKRCGFDPWEGRSPGGGHGNTITKHDKLNVTELKFIVSQFRRLDIRD